MEDCRIGLCFTDGSVRYLFRSTLANAGGYFSARFGTNGMNAGLAYTDEHGQPVYVMEHDGELFAKYIEPFILKRASRDELLPPFAEDPKLWRRLRKEAIIYGLDDLSGILNVTHSCPYSVGDDRGVLYWLGTDKGAGKREYENPQATAAIAVYVGKVGDMTLAENRALANEGTISFFPDAFTQESRQALVQYKPPIVGYREETNDLSINPKQPCHSLWCGMSSQKIPTIIDLRTVTLRLTAYSLRYDECGMTDWNLEGSEDAVEWIALHEARNDRHIAKIDDDSGNLWASEIQACPDDETAAKICQEFVERELRHTWQIESPSQTFFRYFRIIGSGSDYDRHEEASNCLHGVGLELYGDVHED